MLAIISDLHFCDGTATEQNVDPKAFALALSDVYQTASDLAAARKTGTQLDLVFLGDVFDFLRTERWFETRDQKPVPLSDRPWGSVSALDDGKAGPATIARAHAILDEILTVNDEALRTLRGESLSPPGNVEVRRIYFPGNHDRLTLHDDGLRARCLGALKAVDPSGLGGEGIFPHHLAMKQYGLLARHGHEWDAWNFERYTGAAPNHYADADYLVTPIGDPITTELAARLPFLLEQNLRGSRLDANEQADVVKRMQRIEDVRPLLASLQWAFYESHRIHGEYTDVGKKADLADALSETVHTLVTDFRNLQFYGAWEERHHRLLHLDSAEALKAILLALTAIDVGSVSSLSQFFERFVDGKEPRDTCRQGAALEDLRSVGTEGLRFVVYGHTHDPLQIALHVDGTKDVYINSGTFRNTTFRTDDKQGYIGWDRMTYLTFLKQEEMAAFGPASWTGPAFNAWTGSRSR